MKKTNKKKKVAIIGSQGVPPKYGGFETLVDNIISNRSNTVDYTVFCSSPDMDTSLTDYKGCKLKYVNLHAHGVMSVLYDTVSMIKAIRGYDAILVLGVSGGIFLPVFKVLSKAKIIVNIDGLEHKRDKWNKTAKRFLRFSLGQCMKWADEIVSDNKGIQDFVSDTYHKRANLIAYGGDHALRDITDSRQRAMLDFHGLTSGKYDLSICRIEPENNCHLTLEAYYGSGREIAFVGNWNQNDYSRELYNKYKGRPGIHLINPIYDLDALYALRNNCRIYVHGHRAGGTNPSLVEAMFFNKPILAFDVIYNRETTQNKAYYYNDAESLKKLIDRNDLDSKSISEIANSQYIWSLIAGQYENLYFH